MNYTLVHTILCTLHHVLFTLLHINIHSAHCTHKFPPRSVSESGAATYHLMEPRSHTTLQAVVSTTLHCPTLHCTALHCTALHTPSTHCSLQCTTLQCPLHTVVFTLHCTVKYNTINGAVQRSLHISL